MSSRGRMPLLLVLLALLTASCWGGSESVRVLFVGNSYTSSNDLPRMVQELADAVDQRVEVAMVAPGGWWWRDHAASSQTKDALSRGWDFVVLQEQSMAPADAGLARRVSYPAALDLSSLARSNGADVVLFLTWGHRRGSAAVGHPSYASMQVALADSYQMFSELLVAEVAPVGVAWWITRSERPDILLYRTDESHPTMAGSYLAAAVITATLFEVDANTLERSLGLEEETAAALRGFAARAVRGEVPWQP